MDNTLSNPASAVCDLCRPILEWHVPRRTAGSGGQSKFQHQPTPDALKDSSKLCPLCRIFWAQIGLSPLSKDGISYEVVANRKNSIISHVELIPQIREKDVQQGIRAILPEPRVDVAYEDGWALLSQASLVSLLITFPRSLDVSENIDSWPHPWGTFDQRLGLVKRWLKDCKTSHEMCGQQGGYSLRPKRLIHVGTDSSQHPKVVEFQSYSNDPDQIATAPFPSYTALSHCWGPPEKRPLTLTKANSQAYQRSIPWNDFAQNFKDAIAITRKLGLEWIWIDSLCIVQNDREDWQIEAAKMASIYANSEITLAAHDASDSHAGFTHERHQGSEKFHTSVTMPDSEGTPKTLLLRRAQNPRTESTPQSSRNPLYNTVLSRRAWTLQEMILSRRTVHFTKTQLRWQCRECYRTEDSTAEIKLFMTITSPNMLPTPLLTLASIHEDRLQFIQTWQSWVSDFASRKITFASDRAPAIAGMIQHFQLRGATPMLGLFEQSLEFDMLWQPNYHWKQMDLSLSRPASQFPTWSWLSIMGKESPPIAFSPLEADNTTIRVSEFSTSWQGPEYTSQIESSRLVVSGIIRPAKMLVESQDQRRARLVTTDGGKFINECFPDFVSDCFESEVRLLHLSSNASPDGRTIHEDFLILAVVDTADDPPVCTRICRGHYNHDVDEKAVVEFDERFRRDVEIR